MSDLGQLLKKARTQKAITLDELQELTKIRKRYLEAIEEGNYKILPGNFYVRAFIKSYSEAVGLEPVEVLRLYRSVLPEPAPELVSEPKRRTTKHIRNSDKMSKWVSALLLVAFPILIVSILYYYYVHKPNAERAISPPTKLTESTSTPEIKRPAAVVPDPIPDPIVEQPAPTAVVDLVKSEGTTDFYVIKQSQQLIIQLEVVGDKCWMAIKKYNKNGEFIEENLSLMHDEKKEWIFDDSVYFNIGKGNALKITINGTEINMGDKPNPRRLQLDLEKTII
jgi:transcriptional regulator with XRE-family HTH domain/Holliday junction resolvase